MTEFTSGSMFIYSYGLNPNIINITSLAYRFNFLERATESFFKPGWLQRETFVDPKSVGIDQYEI